MKALISFVLIFCFANVVFAEGPKYFAETSDFTIGMYEKPGDLLSQFVPSMADVGNGADYAAFLADKGNEVYKEIRDRQESLYWFHAVIEPVKKKSAFYWPSSNFYILLKDGTKIQPVSVLAMLHFTPERMMVSKVNLYPQTENFTYKDFYAERGRWSEHICYIGVPRSFNLKDIIGITFLPMQAGEAISQTERR